jgi:hypothetical protein
MIWRSRRSRGAPAVLCRSPPGVRAKIYLSTARQTFSLSGWLFLYSAHAAPKEISRECVYKKRRAAACVRAERMAVTQQLVVGGPPPALMISRTHKRTKKIREKNAGHNSSLALVISYRKPSLYVL